MKTVGQLRIERIAVRRRRMDTIVNVIFWSIAALIGGVVVLLIAYLLSLGIGIVDWSFLTLPPSESGPGGGIGPEIYNSFYLLALTLFFTVPLALGAAVYLHEYAPPGLFTRTVQFATESLASVPSIVMGLFGLAVFVYLLHWRFSAIGGALTLTLLNLPALMRVGNEALVSVAQESREASLALGATRWRTIYRVVLPTALPSLVSGIVLVGGRIFGETAALIYTAGVGVSNTKPYDIGLFHPAETLSVHLWYSHAESLVPDVTRIGNGSSCVLLIMVLLFNLLARVVGKVLAARSFGA